MEYYLIILRNLQIQKLSGLIEREVLLDIIPFIFRQKFQKLSVILKIQFQDIYYNYWSSEVHVVSEIATLTNKAPSTISWYLQRLLKAEIVKRKPICLEGIFYKSRFYSVVDKTLVINVLSKYVERSLDKVVNNYSEIIDDL